MTEWISVKEKLPPNIPILTTDGEKMHVAYPTYDNLDDDWRWHTGAGLCCHYCGGEPTCHHTMSKWKYRDEYQFTHWMPLPNPL